MYKMVFITMHNYTKINALQQHGALRSLLVAKEALLVYFSNLPVRLPDTNLVTEPTQFIANYTHTHTHMLFVFLALQRTVVVFSQPGSGL
jgi:hypothetical protein